MLIVDDEESIRFGLSRLLEQAGAKVECVASLSAAAAALERLRPEAVLLDLKLPDSDGLSGLQKIRAARPESHVVMMTGYGTIETAVAAVKAGAEDFLTKPVAPEHLFHVLLRIHDAIRLQNENREKIRQGMPENDLLAALGKPSEKLESKGRELSGRYTYLYADGKILVTLRNRVVTNVETTFY